MDTYHSSVPAKWMCCLGLYEKESNWSGQLCASSR